MGKIAKVLDAEIGHEKEQYEQAKEITKFLKDGPYKLEESEGDVNMSLVRELDGKIVRIEWQLSSPFEAGMDGEEEQGKTSDFTEFSFTVESKKTGAGLTAFCTTEDGEDHRFVIGSVRVFSKEQKDLASAYNGPDFEDFGRQIARSGGRVPRGNWLERRFATSLMPRLLTRNSASTWVGSLV